MPVNKTGKSGAEEQAITTIDPADAADAAALAGGQTLYDARSPELNALLENQPQPFTFEMAPASSVPTSDPIQPRAALFAAYSPEKVLSLLQRASWSEGIVAMMTPIIVAREDVSLHLLRANMENFLSVNFSPTNKGIALAHSLSRLDRTHRIAVETGDDDTPSTYAFVDVNDSQFKADMTALIDNLGQGLHCVTRCIQQMLYTDKNVTKQYLDKVDWTQPDNTKWLINFYLRNPEAQVTKDLLSQLITNKDPLAIQVLQSLIQDRKWMQNLTALSPFLPALIHETRGEVSNILKGIAIHIVTHYPPVRYDRIEYKAELNTSLMTLLNYDLPSFVDLLNTPYIAAETIYALSALPPADQPAASKLLLSNLAPAVASEIIGSMYRHILANIAQEDTDLFSLIVSMADGSYNESPIFKTLGIRLLKDMAHKFKPAQDMLVSLALSFDGTPVDNPYIDNSDAFSKRPEITALWLVHARRDFANESYPRDSLFDSNHVSDEDKLAILGSHPNMMHSVNMKRILPLLERTKNAELRSQLVSYCEKYGFHQNREILTDFFAKTFNPDEAPITDLFLRELKEKKSNQRTIDALEKYKDHPAIKPAWQLYELEKVSKAQTTEAATQLIDPADTPSPVLLAGLLELFANKGFWDMPPDLIGALQTVPVAERLVRESVRKLMDIAAEDHPDAAIKAQIFEIKAKQTELNIAASASAGGGGLEAEITATDGFDELDKLNGFGGVPAGYGFVGNGFFAQRAFCGVKL